MDASDLSIPFLTRDMLRFKDQAVFSLSISHLTTVTGNFYVTGATREGPFTFKVPHDNSSGFHTTEVRIPDIPIWVSITSTLGATHRNGLYVSISLKINGDILRELMAGYVYTPKNLTWPAQTFDSLLPEKYGYNNYFTGANPAAGSEMGDAVPANKVWVINALRFDLVTDANVANRYVHINFLDVNGGNLEAASSIAQTANTTIRYWFAPYAVSAPWKEDNDIFVPIPANIRVGAGGYLQSYTTGKQAGDDFSAPNYWVDEFLYSGS